MKPYLALTLILAALLLTIAGATATTESCNIKNLCYNEADEPYCGPTTTTCTYRYYETSGDTCVESSSISDADSDADSWTNSCDALPEDATEQVDLDGDGFGWHTDCDDLDPAVTTCSGNDDEDNSTTTDNDEDNQGSSSGSTHHTRPLNNVGDIHIILASNETNETGNETGKPLILGSTENKPDSFPGNATNEEENKTSEDQEDKGTMPTGYVASQATGASWKTALIVAGIFGILLVLLALFLRKKN